MEKFKAVEKAMKTKAYSKEGLSAAAKLDPKEQAKVEAGEFLSSMVDDLEQQIESLEAESESIQATMKKGKSQAAKAERMAEIDRVIERHKWHQGKLELIRRSLENGAVDTEQVNEMEENIRYYVSDNMNDDFMEDEGIYDELDLEDEEGTYGMAQDNEKGSSQDTQSIQDDITPEPEQPSKSSRKVQKDVDTVGRKASSQTKSPLPALATLHTPLASASNGSVGSSSMKPAAAPSRPAGEGLKYASAAAAAAASDRGNVGIAPLPPPPGSSVGISPLPPVQSRSSATNSPAIAPAQPTTSLESRAPAPPAEPEIPITTRASKKKATGKQPAAPEPSESSTGEIECQIVQILLVIVNRRFHDSSNEWCHQWYQADCRGTRGGVHLSSALLIARSCRLVRGIAKTATAPIGSIYVEIDDCQPSGVARCVRCRRSP